MKSLITCLPTFALIGFIAVAAARGPVLRSVATGQNCPVAASSLRQQLKVASERLERAEAENHHVIPRGGLSFSPHANPAGIADRGC